MTVARKERKTEMTENDVRTIVREVQDVYEREIAAPRHNATVLNFKDIFDVISTLKGAVLGVGFLVGIPGTIASCLVIVKALRGH